MRATCLLSYIFCTILLATRVRGFHSVRAVEARRLADLPEWPYAFLVSHVGFRDDIPDDIQDANEYWCITAKNGVSDGKNAGFDLCDFVNKPDNQLFLMDSEGKIHSKLDPSQCFVIDQGMEINTGHSKVKFCACDEDVDYTTFTHNRDTAPIRVKNSLDHCIKQNGPRPQNTDSLRTTTCDDTDPCFIFDYKHETNCLPGIGDVKCCNATQCGEDQVCHDYACERRECSTDVDGIECCSDNDCAPTFVCRSNTCLPESVCDVNDIGTECCNEGDCPVNFLCKDKTCVTSAVFLVNAIDGTEYCVSANRGIGEFAQVGSEECNFATSPAKQLWHRDTHNMIRSYIDVNRCIIVGAGQDIFSGLKVNIASCKLNQFLYDSISDLFHLGEDPSYCLMSSQDDPNGAICGKPCQAADRSFEFDLHLAD